MQTIQNPIVFVDTHSEGPRPALDLAISHARAFDAPLRIVDAIDDSAWARAFSGPLLEDVQERMMEEKDAALRGTVARAQEQGVRASFELLHGSPAFAIIHEVLQNQHDIVYKTMAGDPDVRGRLFGNTARRLLRKCPGAVFLVHPRFSAAKRVIAAIGPETHEGEGREMNQAILETASMLARGSSANLHAIQSWELYGAAMLQGHMSADDLMAQAGAHYDEAYGKLTQICEAWPLTPERVHLLEGGTEKVIAEFADQSGSDILVMGSYARTGLKGMLLGNTAEMLLDNLMCSVVTLKLSDFVSPLAE